MLRWAFGWLRLKNARGKGKGKGGRTACALTHDRTAQGAKASGSNNIAPGGLYSGIYAIRFPEGTLTIRPADAVPATSSGLELLTSYNAALPSTQPNEKLSNKSSFEASPIQPEDCGVRMPAGFDKRECN